LVSGRQAKIRTVVATNASLSDKDVQPVAHELVAMPASRGSFYHCVEVFLLLKGLKLKSGKQSTARSLRELLKQAYNESADLAMKAYQNAGMLASLLGSSASNLKAIESGFRKDAERVRQKDSTPTDMDMANLCGLLLIDHFIVRILDTNTDRFVAGHSVLRWRQLPSSIDYNQVNDGNFHQASSIFDFLAWMLLRNQQDVQTWIAKKSVLARVMKDHRMADNAVAKAHDSEFNVVFKYIMTLAARPIKQNDGPLLTELDAFQEKATHFDLLLNMSSIPGEALSMYPNLFQDISVDMRAGLVVQQESPVFVVDKKRDDSALLQFVKDALPGAAADNKAADDIDKRDIRAFNSLDRMSGRNCNLLGALLVLGTARSIDFCVLLDRGRRLVSTNRWLPPPRNPSPDAYLIYPYRKNAFEPRLPEGSIMPRVVMVVNDFPTKDDTVARQVTLYAPRTWAIQIDRVTKLPVSLHPAVAGALQEAIPHVKTDMLAGFQESLSKRSWRNVSQRHHVDLMHSFDYRHASTERIHEQAPLGLDVLDKCPIASFPDYERRVPFTCSLDWWSWDSDVYQPIRFTCQHESVLTYDPKAHALQWQMLYEHPFLHAEPNAVALVTDAWYGACAPRSDLEIPVASAIPFTPQWVRSFRCLASVTPELRAEMDVRPHQFWKDSLDNNLWDALLPDPDANAKLSPRPNIDRLSRQNVRLSLLPYLRFIYAVLGYQFAYEHVPPEESYLAGYLYPLFGQNPSAAVSIADHGGSATTKVSVDRRQPTVNGVLMRMATILCRYALWDDLMTYVECAFVDEATRERFTELVQHQIAIKKKPSAATTVARPKRTASDNPAPISDAESSVADERSQTGSRATSPDHSEISELPDSDTSSRASSPIPKQKKKETREPSPTRVKTRPPSRSRRSKRKDTAPSPERAASVTRREKNSPPPEPEVDEENKETDSRPASPLPAEKTEESESEVHSPTPERKADEPEADEVVDIAKDPEFKRITQDDKDKPAMQPSDLALILKDPDTNVAMVYALITKKGTYTLERVLVPKQSQAEILNLSPKKEDIVELTDYAEPIAVPALTNHLKLVAVATKQDASSDKDLKALIALISKEFTQDVRGLPLLEHNEIWRVVLDGSLSSAFLVSDTFGDTLSTKLYMTGALGLAARDALTNVYVFPAYTKEQWQAVLPYFSVHADLENVMYVSAP